jgi:hypothetical protein
MAFQAAGQLELEQDGAYGGGGQMALPQQFVNRHRRRAQGNRVKEGVTKR